MQILLTGGTGFIGTALRQRLRAEGHGLLVLSRRPGQSSPGIRFVSSVEDINARERIDAVVNLAGAPLAERRWTAVYKREIRASRLDTTRSVIRLLERLERKPDALLSASAIGYYGHHGDEELDESGAATPGFAQALCRDWESLALAAREVGLRVCLLRLGVVLDGEGGAFSRMALPFRFGVGNWLGHGRQWLSWVHRRDVVGAIDFLLQRPDLEGPFNITAPQPVTSRGFCDAMSRHRRVFLSAPVPGPLLRLAVGEMAGELLLNGQRVLPAALQEAGFSFAFPDLDAALSDIV
jgi:uncharacterized protein (TIGR01777 family)